MKKTVLAILIIAILAWVTGCSKNDGSSQNTTDVKAGVINNSQSVPGEVRTAPVNPAPPTDNASQKAAPYSIVSAQWLGCDQDLLTGYSSTSGVATKPDGIPDGHIRVTLHLDKKVKINDVKFTGKVFDHTYVWDCSYGSLQYGCAIAYQNGQRLFDEKATDRNFYWQDDVTIDFLLAASSDDPDCFNSVEKIKIEFIGTTQDGTELENILQKTITI